MSSAMSDNDTITLGHKNNSVQRLKSRKENHFYHFQQKLHYFSISSLLSHCELSEMEYKAQFVEYLYIYQRFISPLKKQKNYAEKFRHLFCRSRSESFKISVGEIKFILRLKGDKAWESCIIKDGYYRF